MNENVWVIIQNDTLIRLGRHNKEFEFIPTQL